MFSEAITPEALDLAQYQESDILQQYSTNARGLIEAAEVTEQSNIEPLRPLLRYVDGRCGRAADFMARGTLTMINGQKGCRKSTFVRALCKILLNGELSTDNPHTLTAKAKGLKVAIIDTEQHKSRLNSTRAWLQKAYTGKDPFTERCKIYEGRGKSCDTLHVMAVNICQHYRPDVLFLDVISHFVDDINDQRTAKDEVTFVNQLCARYGVAVVGLIHQNPSTQATAADKMAGALGTKLLQAAECVLNVARTPAGMERVDDKGDPYPVGTFLYGKGSIITFAEYRERWPDVMQMYLCNENEKGAFELSLHPCEIGTEGKGLSLRKTAYLLPPALVTNYYNAITREELEQQQRQLDFPQDNVLQEDSNPLPF